MVISGPKHDAETALQSQPSSSPLSASSVPLPECFMGWSSPSAAVARRRTPAVSSLASRSLVVNASPPYPRPSNPTILSTETPLTKARTQGKTWTFNRVTRNGALSTLSLMNLVSKCFPASSYAAISTRMVTQEPWPRRTSRCASMIPHRPKSGLKKCTTTHLVPVVRSMTAFSSFSSV